MFLRNSLRQIGVKYGLEDGDIESIGMGQNGCDIVLSPAARRVFDLYIEAKNVESLSVAKAFADHYAKYKDKTGLILLAHTKNRSVPLVTLRWCDFVKLLDNQTGHNATHNG